MSDESTERHDEAREEEGRSPGGANVIRNVGALDWSQVTDPEVIRRVRGIHNAGVIIIAEELAGVLAEVPMTNVGAIVPVPRGVRVHQRTGQTSLTGETLAAGGEDTILLLIGQTIITTPVERVGYREMRVVGQLLAPWGSEQALGPKMAQVTGQMIYYPARSPEQDVRFIMGDEMIGRALLEALPRPVVLVVIGVLTLEEDVTPELLEAKVAAISLVGEMVVPRALAPRVAALTVEKTGAMTVLPARPYSLFEDGETIGREDFEYIEDGSALVISGDVEMEADVDKELVRAKVREVSLDGTLTAPRAVVPLLRSLLSDKSGTIRSA